MIVALMCLLTEVANAGNRLLVYRGLSNCNNKYWARCGEKHGVKYNEWEVGGLGPSYKITLRQNHCYSCMSTGYEEYFNKGLDKIFTVPKNFTAQCDEPMDPRNMQVTPCRTICLTIQQDLFILGQPTGTRLTMRGCALTLSKRGLNNHTLSMFDRYDICREMSAADLFRHDRSDNQRVKVCSCLGDRCNGSLSGSGRLNVFFLLILSFSMLFQ